MRDEQQHVPVVLVQVSVGAACVNVYDVRWMLGVRSKWNVKTAARLSVAFRHSRWKANTKTVPRHTASQYRRLCVVA